MACRTRRAKPALLRIVRAADGSAALDRTGRTPGRGAYVCRDLGCAREAGRPGVLARALRADLRPGDLDTLRMDIEREIGPR